MVVSRQNLRKNHFSLPLPEPDAIPAGYLALLRDYDLRTPVPNTYCAIGARHKRYQQGCWQIFTPKHAPQDTLFGQLTFALKNEGVNLAVLKALFDKIEQSLITDLVRSAPTSGYSRRIWFLYEWLQQQKLPLPDAAAGNWVDLLDKKIQYPAEARKSSRHRVGNNLPGTQNFCPLIRRTEKLERYRGLNLSRVAKQKMDKIRPDLIARAAAFILLKDSKASYLIEGESPPHQRIERWGMVIGQAGQNRLNREELERLQKAVIADHRFVNFGQRVEGGFIGDRERGTRFPLPVHISARWEDLDDLLSGMFQTYALLKDSDYDAVLTAALIAFGFVFIHPFEDGNGRIHRYLFHHVLAEKHFVPPGLIFPVSAVILEKLPDYKKTLEAYSKPRLKLIEWRATDTGNVEVLNKTIDLYRYFDATEQVEFLYACIEETVTKTLPDEVAYLQKYDRMNNFVTHYLDMPDNLVDLLIRFLEQNNGQLSKRARENEFAKLTAEEIQVIEQKFNEFFALG